MGMKKSSWPHIFRAVLFTCVIGGGAGVIGAALTTAYITDYAIELGEVTQNLGLPQPRPRTIPETYEQALSIVEERSLPAVGTLFTDSSLTEAGVNPEDFQATVLSLTSDGWALAASGRVGDMMAFAGKTCEVDDARSEPRLGFVFLHCASTDRPVADFASGYGVRSGDPLFVVMGREVVFTHARAVVWGDTVRSSDVPSRRIRLVTSDLNSGAAVFNVFGELIGVTTQGTQEVEVVPFEHLQGAFKQLLESEELMLYPSFGVRGIDLPRSVGVDEEISQGRHDGFLLYGARAVALGSAASAAGLQEGDLIVAIEGVRVNSDVALDDLLALYHAGDEIRIEIEREGDHQEVMVTLGEIEL
jgi:serine protease Do